MSMHANTLVSLTHRERKGKAGCRCNRGKGWIGTESIGGDTPYSAYLLHRKDQRMDCAVDEALLYWNPLFVWLM
jgi:hypothetical protein